MSELVGPAGNSPGASIVPSPWICDPSKLGTGSGAGGADKLSPSAAGSICCCSRSSGVGAGSGRLLNSNPSVFSKEFS